MGDRDGRLLLLGGMFANYAVVQGADKFMPVDIHIPGCPPRPEALLHGFNKLQRLVRGQPDLGWRQRYNAVGTEEWARLRGGPGPTAEAIERAAAGGCTKADARVLRGRSRGGAR